LSSKPPADDEEDDEESKALTLVNTPDLTLTFDPDKLKLILEVRDLLTCDTLANQLKLRIINEIIILLVHRNTCQIRTSKIQLKF
jgi:hypothetical protein